MHIASGQHYQKYIHKSSQLSHCVGQTLNPKVKGNKKLGGGGGEALWSCFPLGSLLRQISFQSWYFTLQVRQCDMWRVQTN